MSHKRVSQLVEMGASEVSGSDLFYIIDSSAGEGKRIQASSLSAYLASSGSLNAIHSETADTASYILGSGVHGAVASASYATNANSANTASYASSSISSSYALTASFALNASGGSTVSASWASASISSSFATNAINANNAFTAAFLIYTGANNGTASYAMKAKLAENTLLAETASYLLTSGSSVISSSWSDRSGHADSADTAQTAAFLNYTGGNNGTASYALLAGGFSSDFFNDFGVWLATSQSISSSQIDLLQVTSSTAQAQVTNIEAWGTVIVPYTSSIPVNESLTLVVFNRDAGTSSSLDSTPIFVNMTKTVGDWDAEVTGTVKIPFSLIGSSSLYGNYLVYVTGSTSKIQIDSSRINRYNVTSKSDIVTAQIAELPLFNLTPAGTNIRFTSSFGGPYIDTRPGLITTGSSNILVVDVNNQSVNSLRYVWSLTNLTTLRCNGNNSLVVLNGMPNTLASMSCFSCSIDSIDSLANTTMSYFNCAYNDLVTLPALPTSLSYMDCSNNQLAAVSGLPNTMSYLNIGGNFITSIPGTFPSGLTQLYMNDNLLSSLSSNLPSTILTMSVASNPTMTSFTSTLPSSLKRLEFGGGAFSTIPSIPSGTLYMDGISGSLSQGGMNSICSQSLSNGLSNGFLYLNGNGFVTITTESDFILPLQSAGWTVGYDGAA